MFMSTNQTQCVYVIWHYGQGGSLKHTGWRSAVQDQGGFMVRRATEKSEASDGDERLSGEAGRTRRKARNKKGRGHIKGD